MNKDTLSNCRRWCSDPWSKTLGGTHFALNPWKPRQSVSLYLYRYSVTILIQRCLALPLSGILCLWYYQMFCVLFCRWIDENGRSLLQLSTEIAERRNKIWSGRAVPKSSGYCFVESNAVGNWKIMVGSFQSVRAKKTLHVWHVWTNTGGPCRNVWTKLSLRKRIKNCTWTCSPVLDFLFTS